MSRRQQRRASSVAVIGGGASGAITAAVLQAEGVFDVVRVFERRSEVGGVWCYDALAPHPPLVAGDTEASTDPPLAVPPKLPARTPIPPDSSRQERWIETPNYETLTTNVPALGMCYSDQNFDVPNWREQPFVHHSVVRRYIVDYFAAHGVDGADTLVRDTTVEEVTKDKGARWKLVLRRREGGEDVWWDESFDAVIVAVGHYHVPYIPPVPGLKEFQAAFPGVVEHSKFYRSPEPYTGKKVLIIGNRASGTDILRDVLPVATQPVYQSRRSLYAWSQSNAPVSTVYKPVVLRYEADTGRVVFADGTVETGFDKIVYTTGYRYSYPFLHRQIPQLSTGNRITGTYQHTWWAEDPTLSFVGSVIDAVSFRAFEFQAIAVSRYLAGYFGLPSLPKMRAWEQALLQETGDARAFHTIGWMGAQKYWEEMVALAGGLEAPGRSKGRAFPVVDDAFWDELSMWKDRKLAEWKGEQQQQETTGHSDVNVNGSIIKATEEKLRVRVDEDAGVNSVILDVEGARDGGGGGGGQKNEAAVKNERPVRYYDGTEPLPPSTAA